jgi:hypothetical protein
VCLGEVGGVFLEMQHDFAAALLIRGFVNRVAGMLPSLVQTRCSPSFFQECVYTCTLSATMKAE